MVFDDFASLNNVLPRFLQAVSTILVLRLWKVLLSLRLSRNDIGSRLVFRLLMTGQVYLVLVRQGDFVRLLGDRRKGQLSRELLGCSAVQIGEAKQCRFCVRRTSRVVAVAGPGHSDHRTQLAQCRILACRSHNVSRGCTCRCGIIRTDNGPALSCSSAQNFIF